MARQGFEPSKSITQPQGNVMTIIIGFLESVGSSAELRYATTEQLQQALSPTLIDAQAQAAILGNDRPALQSITGSPTIANKVITPGKEEEDEDEVPERDDDEIRSVRPGAFVTA